MNKNSKLYFFIVLLYLVLFSSVSLGQEAEISKDEFFSAVNNATDKASATNRRIIRTSVIYSDGKIVGEERETIEYILPDKRRSLVIEKKDGKETSIEKISIGDAKFIKQNGGKWENVDESGKRSIIALTRGPEPKYTHTFLVRELKKQNGKHYILNVVRESGDSKTYSSETYLINNAGVLKEIITIFSKETKENIYSNAVETYEYDPKDLKIEAPVISNNNP
ncbi:MAG: hypothetical protein R2681_06160 [Pyrinomonadaceae bacterium]